MPKSLSDITDDELARLILRQLWGFQDAGGVSKGRSMRSVLLEAALDLIPLPTMDDIDRFTIFDLHEASWQRPRRPSQEQIAFPVLAFLSDHDLAMELLWSLMAWYEEDAKADPMRALSSEQKMLSFALGLLPRSSGRFAREDLIIEARERSWVRFHAQYEKEDRILWASLP